MGGCTDESFNAPACNPACTDLDPSDVVYNQTTSNWHCCGQTNGTIHCDDPTTESFQAPAPSALVATYMVPSVVQTAASSTSASTSASTSTSTSTSTSMSTSMSNTTTHTSSATQSSSSSSNNGGSSGLSRVTQDGIGIGVTIAGVAILGLLGLFFLRRRCQQRATCQHLGSKEGPFAGYHSGGRYGHHTSLGGDTDRPQTPSPVMQPQEMMADGNLSSLEVQELDGVRRGGRGA